MKAKNVLIAPSILSADFARLSDEVKRIERAGADWLHVDVMDGHFVPNLTIGPVVVKWLKKYATAPLDVHLMIDNPDKYIPAFAKAGSSFLTVHWEACTHPKKTIDLIKKCGCKAGMTIRPKTPVQKIAPYLKYLDLALVMTVEPGFGGQSFMPDMLPKLQWLRQRISQGKLSCRLEVDGGINLDTVLPAVQAGADVLVAGNAVFGEPNAGRALKKLRQRAMS